jgi:putative membrane protein
MMMMGFGLFGLLFMLLFLIIIVVAAVAAISWLFPRPLSAPPQGQTSRGFSASHAEAPLTHSSAGQAETPLDILKRRYARGEITREEFEAMKEDLLA